MTAKRIHDPRGQILNAIRTSMRTRGYPPTMRELADVVGFLSTGSVAYHLRILQEQGALKKVPGQARAIVIADIYPTESGAGPDAPEPAPDPTEGITS